MARTSALARFDGLLRRGDFVTDERARRVGRIIFAVCSIALAIWIATLNDLKDPLGRLFAADYSAFWTAGRVALESGPAAAYDPFIAFAFQERTFDIDREVFMPFWNPPPFLFLAIAVSIPPFAISYGTFLVTTATFAVSVVRRFLPASVPLIVFVGAPYFFVNIFTGQLAFLISGISGLALLSLLGKREWLAGFFVGLLVLKPQFGLFFPLLFAFGGHWRAFAMAAFTLLGTMLASYLAFGAETWIAFFELSKWSSFVLLDSGGIDWAFNLSAYAALRQLWFTPALAYAGQAVSFAIAAIMLLRILMHSDCQRLKISATLVATLLSLPYVMMHDALFMAPAVAMMAGIGLDRGFRDYEKTVLATAWLAPLFVPSLSKLTHLPFGYAVNIALFLIIYNRVFDTHTEPSLQPNAERLAA